MLFSAARKMQKIVESFVDSCIKCNINSGFDDNKFFFQELRNMAHGYSQSVNTTCPSSPVAIQFCTVD